MWNRPFKHDKIKYSSNLVRSAKYSFLVALPITSQQRILVPEYFITSSDCWIWRWIPSRDNWQVDVSKMYQSLTSDWIIKGVRSSNNWNTRVFAFLHTYLGSLGVPWVSRTQAEWSTLFDSLEAQCRWNGFSWSNSFRLPLFIFVLTQVFTVRSSLIPINSPIQFILDKLSLQRINNPPMRQINVNLI